MGLTFVMPVCHNVTMTSGTTNEPTTPMGKAHTMTTVTGNDRRRVHAGRIVIGDHDTPVCDVHGDTAHTTGMTVETGASMYRCNVCGASGWVGV